MTLPAPTRADLGAACLAALRDALEMANFDVPEPLGEAAVLLGPGAVFDSLALVSYVLEVEQRVRERFGARVSLTDERAMSRRESPFRTVGSLVEYLDGLVSPGRRADG